MLEEFRAYRTQEYEQDCKTNQKLHCISSAGTPKPKKMCIPQKNKQRSIVQLHSAYGPKFNTKIESLALHEVKNLQ